MCFFLLFVQRKCFATAILVHFGLTWSVAQITMAKKQGSKTIVLGGKKGVQQQYCGTVGGQSTDFSTIDTEVKVWLHS